MKTGSEIVDEVAFGNQGADIRCVGEGMSRSTHIRNPEVSVLMSCYNGSRWLQEAIDSVLAQTFESFEFILVDDGSTDETWDIIERYRARDERIIAIAKKNTGLADSLNVGIMQARGTWIARLDQDDLCEQMRLEDQVNFMRNHPEIVLLGAGCIEIEEHGRIIKKHRYPSGHRKLVCFLERLQRFFPHSSAFYRVKDVRNVGGYNLRISRAEDRRLWLALALRGKMACLSKPLVRIRKHSSQMSLDDNGRRQLCDAIAATVCHFLQKAGSKDPSVDASTDEWIEFMKWVESRIDASGYLSGSKAWVDARSAFFATKNRLAGAFHFAGRILRSGHASELVWEKFFGSSLPQRLAREWIMLTQ